MGIAISILLIGLAIMAPLDLWSQGKAATLDVWIVFTRLFGLVLVLASLVLAADHFFRCRLYLGPYGTLGHN